MILFFRVSQKKVPLRIFRKGLVIFVHFFFIFLKLFLVSRSKRKKYGPSKTEVLKISDLTQILGEKIHIFFIF